VIFTYTDSKPNISGTAQEGLRLRTDRCVIKPYLSTSIIPILRKHNRLYTESRHNRDNVRVTWQWDPFKKPLLPWKSNKLYIFVCVCACASACVSVGGCECTGAGVCLRACSLANPACNAPPYSHLRPLWLHNIFRHYLINGPIFGTKSLNIKCEFYFSLQLLFETFLILRRIRWDIDINVKTSSYKVHVIFVGF
jgi:hypothetical protein